MFLNECVVVFWTFFVTGPDGLKGLIFNFVSNWKRPVGSTLTKSFYVNCLKNKIFCHQIIPSPSVPTTHSTSSSCKI
ncbi:hypothetical protein BDFB_003822 [Asbolus verrucosus]|uniref:Uncharacterized protein n=1 Tax=Asbolus verrucosus TaxID=1661398 RepID=A0A482VLC3_ASBVE|nr:hypothetical protein BDFB_003822 [Asbolus verrucosus]